MSSRRALAVYYAWDYPAEIAAPLAVIEDRFPALFETRRMLYPRYAELGDPEQFDQGVGGFIDYILKANFRTFIDHAAALTGRPVIEIERVDANGERNALDDSILRSIDTLVVISFDSTRTSQSASPAEISALNDFLARPDNVAFVCPHHHIDDAEGKNGPAHDARLAAFAHHGDPTLPPRQRFGGFARTLLEGLGAAVDNRFGLRPARGEDGAPAAIEVAPGLDRLGLLHGVPTFNLHPHLPHLERRDGALAVFDVLARQPIDPTAPPHPFTRSGRWSFDALLQSKADAFAGALLVGDATLWSSTAGGLDSLRRLWTNVLIRPGRAAS